MNKINIEDIKNKLTLSSCLVILISFGLFCIDIVNLADAAQITLKCIVFLVISDLILG